MSVSLANLNLIDVYYVLCAIFVKYQPFEYKNVYKGQTTQSQLLRVVSL